MTIRLIRAFVVVFSSATAAWAVQESESRTMGMLLPLFLGFFAIIIVFQLIPSLLVVLSMVKGVFSARGKDVVSAAGQKSDDQV